MSKFLILLFTITPIFRLFLFSLLPDMAFAQELLTWQDCINEAAKNHPDLISMQEAINQDRLDKAITASALLPRVDANLGAQTQKTAGQTADTYSYGVSSAQLIFDGFKTLNDINSAKENIKAAQHAYRFTSSQVRLSLRTAFINLLRAQELIQVAKDIAAIRKASLELIVLRYYSGLEHRAAMLTAEANLASANYEFSQAERRVEFAQRQLTKEMGRQEFKPMQVEGDFIVRESVKENPGLERLALVNPSYLQAVSQKNSAGFGIKSAYANFSPELSGNFGVSKAGSRWTADRDQWNLGLSLTLPLFEGGLRLAQLAQAKAIYRQLEADERSVKDSIIVNLEQDWVSLKDALENVDVQRKTLEAAVERSKIAEAQYSTGFIAFDNWIIIEDNLVTAKRAYVEAQANALLSEASWIQAKGETLEYAQ